MSYHVSLQSFARWDTGGHVKASKEKMVCCTSCWKAPPVAGLAEELSINTASPKWSHFFSCKTLRSSTKDTQRFPQMHFIHQMPHRLALQEFITIYQSWICLCEDPATTSTVLSMGLLIQNINRAWVMVCATAQAEFHPFNCMTGHLVLLLLPLCMRIIV